jgi:hypothetical protein
MAKLKNRRDRRQASIKARVITTLFNTPGMSDNEICKHIGVDIQRGTQIRYLLYRDGKIVSAGSRNRGGRIVKTWKMADSFIPESKQEIKPSAFEAPEIVFESFVRNSDTANLGAKLEWLSKIFNKYPDLVDTIVPITNRDGLLSAAQEIESILSHPFNFLLGSNE